MFLGKKRIGEHSFLFAPSSDGVKVQSRASFNYRLLNISLYKYEHFSEENYDSENCLVKINSSTVTHTRVRGSVKQKITGQRKDNGFSITGSNEEQLDKNCVMPFAYWNPKFLKQTSLLNAQTGKETSQYASYSVIESGAKYSLREKTSTSKSNTQKKVLDFTAVKSRQGKT